MDDTFYTGYGGRGDAWRCCQVTLLLYICELHTSSTNNNSVCELQIKFANVYSSNFTRPLDGVPFYVLYAMVFFVNPSFTLAFILGVMRLFPILVNCSDCMHPFTNHILSQPLVTSCVSSQDLYSRRGAFKFISIV